MTTVTRHPAAAHAADGQRITVYFAGLISGDDWRSEMAVRLQDDPVLAYGGPFLRAFDPDPAAGGGPVHRALAGDEGWLCWASSNARSETLHHRLEDLRQADAVFAWFSRLRSHWTAAEVAIAVTHGVPVFLAVCSADYPSGPQADGEWTYAEGMRDLALLCELVGQFYAVPTVEDALDAFRAWCVRERLVAGRKGAASS